MRVHVHDAQSLPSSSSSSCPVIWMDGKESEREGLCVVCMHTHREDGGYLVDPASSHMLVSKIKPCMSKYKLVYTARLRMAH